MFPRTNLFCGYLSKKYVIPLQPSFGMMRTMSNDDFMSTLSFGLASRNYWYISAMCTQVFAIRGTTRLSELAPMIVDPFVSTFNTIWCDMNESLVAAVLQCVLDCLMLIPKEARMLPVAFGENVKTLHMHQHKLSSPLCMQLDRAIKYGYISV